MKEIAFDAGAVANAVIEVVKNSSIADKVDISHRESMVGKGQIMTLTDVSMHRWSTSEIVLWRFLESLSGYGEVNLATLAQRFGNGHLAPYLAAAVFMALSNRQIVPGAYAVVELDCEVPDGPAAQ